MICNYRDGALMLDTLVQRIEGISEALGISAWSEAVFPVLLSIEQVNAVALEAKRALTEEDKALVSKSLCELEALVDRFEAGAG